MKRLVSIAALALVSGSVNAMGIPGLYRWSVPYVDASKTTGEYLADRYGVEENDIAVKDVALNFEEERYSTVAYVANDVCQVTLSTGWRTLEQSNFAVKSAECVPQTAP